MFNETYACAANEVEILPWFEIQYGGVHFPAHTIHDPSEYLQGRKTPNSPSVYPLLSGVGDSDIYTITYRVIISSTSVKVPSGLSDRLWRIVLLVAPTFRKKLTVETDPMAR